MYAGVIEADPAYCVISIRDKNKRRITLPQTKKFSAGTKQKTPTSCDVRVSYKKVAATYSPTWWGSTIGDGELNFSVRNGKRWILTAITATICF